MLGPKGLALAVKELEFTHPNPTCYLLANTIDVFNVECDDLPSDMYIDDYLTDLRLPKGIHVVGLRNHNRTIVGIVNFGNHSFME